MTRQTLSIDQISIDQDRSDQDRKDKNLYSDDERQKLAISLWQSNSKVFNTLSGFKRPNDWKAFWNKTDLTLEQIEIGFKNYVEGINSGALERRFVPSHVDTFVLNGWIQKSQDPYRKQSPPSKSAGYDSGRKSLGGLDDV